MHDKHAHAVQAAAHGQAALQPVIGAGGAQIVSVHAPPAPPSFLDYVFLTLTVVLKESDEQLPGAGASASSVSQSRKSSSAEEKKQLLPQPQTQSSEGEENGYVAPPMASRRVQLKHRQDFVRYICLSELLKRIVHHLSTIDRYMTLVASASVSAMSLAMANSAAAQSAPSSALSSPTANTAAAAAAAGRVTPPTNTVGSSTLKPGPLRSSGGSSGTKDRLTAKLASQRSLKSKETTPSKTPSPSVYGTGGPGTVLQPLPHVPIHTPVVPHAPFVTCVTNFIEALTTLPSDAATLDATATAAATTSSSASSGKKTTASFIYALQRALKDCVCAGLLSLIASVTLSHWIIPTSKPPPTPAPAASTGGTGTPPHPAAASSAVVAPISSLSSRDKALATVLSNESAGILVAALRVLVNIARVDLPLLQEFSDSFQPHLFGILSFLLPYCLMHLPKPNISAQTVANTLLELLLSLMGSLALLAPANQRMMTQWRDEAEPTTAPPSAGVLGEAASEADAASPSTDSDRPPTLLQQLCHLPSHFYVDPRLQALLFPTILACAYDPTSASATAVSRQILADNLSPMHMQHLQAWMEMSGGGGNGTLLSLSFDSSDAAGDTAPARSPTSATSLRASPPLSPAESKSAISSSTGAANGGLVLKKRSSSAAGSLASSDTADSTGSAIFSAPSLAAAPKRKPAVPLAPSSARSSLRGKDAAAVAAAVAATASASSGGAVHKSARALTAASKSATGELTGVTEPKSISVVETPSSSSSAASPVPSPPPTPGPAAVPVALISPAARADIARRFPLELLKNARAQLFD
jgi:hypothetical protein